MGELGERLARPAAGWRAAQAAGVRWATACGAGSTRAASRSGARPANCSRVQTLSRASFSGLGSGRRPRSRRRRSARARRCCGRRVRRRPAGWPGRRRATSMTVVITARVKPCTGVSVGRAQEVHARRHRRPAVVAGRPARPGPGRSARRGTPARPRAGPRYASWCGWSAIRRYSRSTRSTSASCISQNADFGWVTQPCSSPASASGSRVRSANSPSAGVVAAVYDASRVPPAGTPNSWKAIRFSIG